MVFITHLLLEFMLVVLCLYLLAGLIRGAIAVWQEKNPRPFKDRARDFPFLLFAVGLIGYVAWTLGALALGHRALGHSGEVFRHQVFNNIAQFQTHAEAKATLGNGRYEQLLKQGASLGEMAQRLRGAPSDPRRIAAVRHVLRGQLLDRHGEPLIAYEIDSTGTAMDRVYDPHPGLRRLLGAFNPSPVRKTGLEWAYREALVPAQADRYALFEAGTDVQLSLDAALQKVAYEALNINGVQRKGSVVVMNPQTGDVYAMVSSPSEPPAPLADPQVEQAHQALLGFHRRVMQVSAQLVSRAPRANVETVQHLRLDLKDVRAALRPIETRWLPDTLAALTALFGRVEGAITYTTEALGKPAGEQPDLRNVRQLLQNSLVHLDRVRHNVLRVHRDVLAQAFYAHERMHFRQSPVSLGSAFKPFMAALAEDLGIARDFQMTLHDARALGVPRKILSFEQDHLPREDRWRTFDVREGLFRSLNTVFAPLTKAVQTEIGTDALVEYLGSLGFNRPIQWHSAYEGLNRSFPIYTSNLYAQRLYPHQEGYYRANIYSLGIGGENMMQVTPLHVAMMGAYLANEAYLPTPKLELNLAPKPFSAPHLGESSLRRVKSYMQASVTERKGTSHLLAYGPLKPLYIAAKTGTSTRLLSPFETDKYGLKTVANRERTGYESWSLTLVGPEADDLRAVVVVHLSDAVPAGYDGTTKQSEWASRIAVPIAKEILIAMQAQGYFD